MEVATQSAKRGFIYEFREKDGAVKNTVLVISSNHRQEDNLISILMLGTKYTGKDCIEVKLADETRYVHCGLVTYASRARLGDILEEVPVDVMERISNNIAYQLGINDGIDYKQLYDDLMSKVVSK